MALTDPNKVQFATGPAVYGQRQDTPFSLFVRVAQRAEEVGFAGIHAVDHMFLAPDRMLSLAVDPKRPYQGECFTTLAALAAVTSKVIIGPLVTPFSMRHPSIIAKMGAQIDIISNGRLVLGCGTGWGQNEHASFGLPYDTRFSQRYGLMMEGVQVLKRLWTEDDWVSFEGEHLHLQNAPLWPKPVQKPHPPIWFGGSGASIRRAVAQLGDGWCPAAPHFVGLPPEVYREGLEDIRTLAREEFGRDPSAITAGLTFYTAIGATHQKALEKAAVVHQRSDWKDIPLDDLQRKGVVVVGDPGEVAEHLNRYVEAGCRYFQLYGLPLDLDEQFETLELYATHILPQFR